MGQIKNRTSLFPSREEERKTCLDLVVDEESSDLVATFSERSQEIFRSFEDTSLSLDRFDDDAASLFRHGLIDRCNVVQGCGDEAGDQGGERSLVLVLPRRREGAHAPAVEPVAEADNLDLFVLVRLRLRRRRRSLEGCRLVEFDVLAVLAGKLDRALVRLCARIREEDFQPSVLGRLSSLRSSRVTHAAEFDRVVDDRVGEFARVFVVPQVAAVDQPLGLVLDDSCDSLVCVPEGVDGDPSREVEVLAVSCVVHAAAFAAREDEVGSRVRVERHFRVPVELVEDRLGHVVVEVGRREVVHVGLGRDRSTTRDDA